VFRREGRTSVAVDAGEAFGGRLDRERSPLITASR
jgi:hypothetical protein